MLYAIAAKFGGVDDTKPLASVSLSGIALVVAVFSIAFTVAPGRADLHRFWRFYPHHGNGKYRGADETCG
jgi:hypothetical protein